MPKASAEKQAYWRSVLRRQQNSGLSVRQFCMDEQLSDASFYRWRRKIASGDRGAVASLEKDGPKRSKTKRDANAKQNQNAAVFIPVRLNAAAGSLLEVVHPRGHVVRVPTVFDENSLRQVLNILDQQGDR